MSYIDATMVRTEAWNDNVSPWVARTGSNEHRSASNAMMRQARKTWYLVFGIKVSTHLHPQAGNVVI